MRNLAAFKAHQHRAIDKIATEINEAQNYMMDLMMSDYLPSERIGIVYHQGIRMTICGVGGHATAMKIDGDKPSKLDDFKSCLGHALSHHLDGHDLPA